MFAFPPIHPHVFTTGTFYSPCFYLKYYYFSYGHILTLCIVISADNLVRVLEHFSRTRGERVDRDIIMAIYRYQPVKPWRLQYKLRLYPRTFAQSIEHLTRYNIVTKNAEGFLWLTEATQKDCDQGIQVIIPSRPLKRNTGKKISEKVIIDGTYLRLMVVSVAAFGNYSFEPIIDLKPGNGSIVSTSVTYDKGIAEQTMCRFIPKHKPGSGLSDFRKVRDGVGLEMPILEGFSQVFAYKDFLEPEMQKCIKELIDGKNNNPILKEITIFDHEFLFCVYDSENPHLVTLHADGSGMGDGSKIKKRIIMNEDNNRLKFYHDILYNNNNYSEENQVQSRIVFDINNERTIKFLELDTLSKNKNNSFSTSLWYEPRYIIADPFLGKFIVDCWHAFMVVSERMRYTYIYDMWPKERGSHNKYRSVKIDDLTIRELYIKWYKQLFGNRRFYGFDFNSYLRSNKRDVDKIEKFRRYLKKLEHKKELKYSNRGDIMSSYKRIRWILQDNPKNIINFYDKAIKKDYENIMDQRYKGVREKYNDITTQLLHLIYPGFLEKFNVIPKVDR